MKRRLAKGASVSGFAPLVVLLALPAWGAAVSLKYISPPGCPDEAVLRQLVAARLGADPFVPVAGSVVTVRVTAFVAFDAEVVLESPEAPTRRKTLSGTDCLEVLQSVAVTVALVIDPVIKKPEAPAVAVAPPPEPVAVPPPPPGPRPPLLHWSVAAGATANFGLAVTAQPTLRLEGRVRGGLWSIGLEGRFAWPVSGAVSQGVLTTSAVLGAIVPCLHWKWLAGCADLSLGALRLEGSALASAQAATVFHASAGLRAVLLVPVTAHFSAGVMAEGQVPFTRASAVVGTERVWSVAPVGFGAGGWFSFLL